MKTFLLAYFLIGGILASIAVGWANGNGEKADILDFLIITVIYPYYLYKLLLKR